MPNLDPAELANLVRWDGVNGPEPLDQPYIDTDWNIIAFRCSGCGRGAIGVSLRPVPSWRSEHEACAKQPPQTAAKPAPVHRVERTAAHRAAPAAPTTSRSQVTQATAQPPPRGEAPAPPSPPTRTLRRREEPASATPTPVVPTPEPIRPPADAEVPEPTKTVHRVTRIA